MKRAIILLSAVVLISSGIGFLLSMQNEEDSKFEKTLSTYLDEMWKFYPTAATMAGYHKYDDKLENLAEKSLDKRREALDKFNQDFVAKIDKFKLSPDTQIDHEIIVDILDREILDHDNLLPWEYNPLYYNEIILNCLRGLLTSESASLSTRLQNAEKRLGELPKFLKRAQESLKTPPKIFTETAIKQFPEIIKFYREELPKYYNQAPEVKAKVQAAAEKALAALVDYQNFLSRELLSRSEKENFRLGDAAHRRLIRLTFKNSIPLEDLLANARADLKNMRREMFLVCIPYFKIMYPHINLEQLGTQGSEEAVWNTGIKGVFEEIKNNHVGKNELLPKIKSLAEDIKKFINESKLIDLPANNFTIQEMPPADRGMSYIRLTTPNVYEQSNNYAFQVAPIPENWSEEKTESYLQEYSNYLLPFWVIRKVFPGMYLPTSISRKSSSLLRNLCPNMPLLKGWSFYLEELLVESGYGNWDLFLRLHQLKYYIRSVIDFLLEFNIHEGSMTQEQAFDLMIKMGFQTEAEAERKWTNIAINPCDAAYTYVGIQEIADIERQYKSLKGNAYDEKEFRTKLLSFGAIPIRFLKERILQR